MLTPGQNGTLIRKRVVAAGKEKDAEKGKVDQRGDAGDPERKAQKDRNHELVDMPTIRKVAKSFLAKFLSARIILSTNVPSASIRRLLENLFHRIDLEILFALRYRQDGYLHIHVG